MNKFNSLSYRCLDCGRIFEVPKEYTETHGLDTPPYETWRGCPFCSGAYEPVKNCKLGKGAMYVEHYS